MDVHDAAYRVAHDFRPDGAVGLARKLGKNPGTFLNQVNPQQDTAKLSLGDSVAMSLAAGDFRILHAFNDTCGFFGIRKPDFSRVSDASLLEILLKRDVEQGDFAEAVQAGLENGSLSPDEYARIEREGYEAAAAIMELVVRLRGLVVEPNP